MVSEIEKRAVRHMLQAKPNEIILDIGTGSGRIGHAIGTHGAKIIGIDTSTEMIAPAIIKKRTEGLKKYEIIMADAEHMPFKEGSFDAIICLRVLKWVSHYPPVIAEMSKVLKPGGRLVLDVANIFGWEILIRLPTLIKNHQLGKPTLFRISQVKKTLRENHLDVVDSSPLHKFPLSAWNWFKNPLILRALLKADSFLKQITPQQFLSRSILLKCISQKAL